MRFAQLEDVARLQALLLDGIAVELGPPRAPRVDEDDGVVRDFETAMNARGPRIGQLDVAIFAAAQHDGLARREIEPFALFPGR